jgi:hypothetical protein
MNSGTQTNLSLIAAGLLAHLAEANATHAAQGTVISNAVWAADTACNAAVLAMAYATCKTPQTKTSFPPDREEKIKAEEQQQIRLLREVTGNPFQPVVIQRGWLTDGDGAVVRLAQAAYEERQLPSGLLDNARFAVLADALEEAGCTDETILGHCREPGEHVRGCWLLDLLLVQGRTSW